MNLFNSLFLDIFGNTFNKITGHHLPLALSGFGACQGSGQCGGLALTYKEEIKQKRKYRPSSNIAGLSISIVIVQSFLYPSVLGYVEYTSSSTTLNSL